MSSNGTKGDEGDGRVASTGARFSAHDTEEPTPHTPQPQSRRPGNVAPHDTSASTLTTSTSTATSQSCQTHHRSLSLPERYCSATCTSNPAALESPLAALIAKSPSPLQLDVALYDRPSNATTPHSRSSNLGRPPSHFQHSHDDTYEPVQNPVDALAGRMTPFHFFQENDSDDDPHQDSRRPMPRSLSPVWTSQGNMSSQSIATGRSNGTTVGEVPSSASSSIFGHNIWTDPPPTRAPRAPSRQDSMMSLRFDSDAQLEYLRQWQVPPHQSSRDEVTDLASQGIGREWAPTLTSLTRSTLELTNRVGMLSDMSMSLRDRVLALERDRMSKSQEIEQLRGFIQNTLMSQQQQHQPQLQSLATIDAPQQRPVLTPLRPPSASGWNGGRRAYGSGGQLESSLQAYASPYTPQHSRHHTPSSSIGSFLDSIGGRTTEEAATCSTAGSFSYYGSASSSLAPSPIVSQGPSISNFAEYHFASGPGGGGGFSGATGGEGARGPFRFGAGALPAPGEPLPAGLTSQDKSNSSANSVVAPLWADKSSGHRRSRGSEPGTSYHVGGQGHQGRDGGRDRGGSMSAMSPLAAQAQWMARQTSFEHINYRALLENETDIDDEAFVRRVINQNDQQCSLFLQQRVRSTSSDLRRRSLFNAVSKHLLPLAVSKFGNFLVSRCLEYGGSELASMFTQRLKGRFLELALDHAGCHVVQKLLDYGGQVTKTLVVNEMMDQPMTLTSKNACHCWNRLLSTVNPPEFYEGLARTGRGLWAEITKEEGGSLVCQHTLEDWAAAHTSVIARELYDSMEQIAKSSCGSFVLSTLLDRNALPCRAKLMDLAPGLALDSFGAKVLEKAIRTGKIQAHAVATFVELICRPRSNGRAPVLVDVASHANGAQLINVLLTGGNSASYEGRMMIARTVSQHAVHSGLSVLVAQSALKHAPHGQRVWNICQAMTIR
ncbi:BQ2448_5943 [Microbotryum intermedium]|uniref:BQ2448_5943 protein n=1 Tax=Microbotryum intermedium TaxID=269621 RepID=A0A238F2M4_9BASI|nr:BQ2448_5943 [Microbotryum intermedium]